MTKTRRLIAFIWIIIFISVPNTFAQEDILKKKITVSFQDETLGKILKTLEELGGFHFSYRNKYVPANKKISLEAQNESISSILHRLLNGLDLEYTFVEGKIVLHPVIKKKTEKPEAKFSINGYIRDNASGESLIGATIFVDSTTTGTVSNAYGFYSLTLPPGKYQLVYSFVGYEPQRLDIKLDSDQMVNVDIDQDQTQIQEVVITKRSSERAYGDLAQLSMTDMKPKQVKKIPALLGEVDVIKSLESLPGITFFGDGSTFFYVRGGNKDQNQILIDDAPIFNPAHLFGFFSNIIPDAIKDVRIYKGNMGPQKGGRLSSLIDIRTRDGNMKKIGVSGGVGLISARLSVEGPVVKDKSSFFISGRRSYFKWFVKQYSPQVQDIYFSDFNAKFNLIANSSNRFYLTLYLGKDDFTTLNGGSDAAGINWGNVSGSFRWNHLFGERLFLNTILYGGKYDYSLLTSVNRNDKWNSTITNTGLKTDFSFYMDPSNTLRFGMDIGFYEINPGNFTFGDISKNENVPWVPVKNSLEWNLYFNYERKLGEKFNLYLGLRGTLWQSVGPTTEYVFNDSHKPVASIDFDKKQIYNYYFSPEPRLGISYLLSETSSLTAAYARNIQNIHQINNSVSPFTSLDVWLPSGPNIQPQIANQVSLGYNRNVFIKTLKLKIEAYYKKMENQIDYEYHAQMLLNPLVEGELRFGEAWSYGIEFLIEKETGKLTGNLSYSFSKTTKQFPEIYQNEAFPAFYDRPHELSSFLSYLAGKRWTLAAMWTLTSGAAYTTPGSFFYYQGHSVPIYSEKNNDRLPPYHRLDVSIGLNMSKIGGRFKHDLSVSVYNLYGRHNPIAVNFNKIENPYETLLVPGNYYELPVLVPSHLYFYNFVPSLNYNFRF